MSRPQAYLTRMFLFLAVVALVAVGLYQPVQQAFVANPGLNGLILAVALLGVAYIVRQVLTLRPEVEWLAAFRDGRADSVPTPHLLAPMARMLGERSGRLNLSAIATRALLDGVAARLDESREIGRYLTGLLIFLGLLGTFWGLLQTVSAIGGVIGGLRVEGADVGSVFTELQQGLQSPLAGMGTAFSSSLFGLAGSLVLGFLELQAAQAQNRFYADLEDWLAGATRLSSGGIAESGDQPLPAYLQALLETTAENIEKLHRTMAQAEDNRRAAGGNLMALTEKLGALTDHMRTEQSLMLRLAENQAEMRPILHKLAESMSGGGMDEATRGHIRNLDLHLSRLADELATGRERATEEIRSEIKILTRTLTALADGDR